MTGSSGTNIKQAKPANSSATGTSVNHPVITCDQCFADGSIIELSSGATNQPNLLLYSEGTTISGTRVKYAGCVYEAPNFHPALLRATRLPKTAMDYGSPRELVNSIADHFRKIQNFAEREAKLLAAFCVTTWVSDRLSFAPSLMICGPDEGVQVLRLLSCFCRRPLLLADLNAAGFRKIPRDLRFSLLLAQPNMTKSMCRLLGASGYKGLHVLANAGAVADLFCSKAVFCGMDFENVVDDAIQIFVEPDQFSDAINERDQHVIADEFQRKLLAYRLQNVAKIQSPKVGPPKLSAPLRQVAMNLAASFCGDSELTRELYSLLLPQDQEFRDRQAESIEHAIVEILMGVVHKGQMRHIPVNEIARLANALQRDRGQLLNFNHEEVGWKLKTMRIYRHRISSGSVIKFDSGTKLQVHRLARRYGVAVEIADAERCKECRTSEAVSQT